MAGCRLDQVLARLLPEHSRNRLQGWVRDGRIRVDGAAAEPRRKLWGGETLQVEPDATPGELAQAPEAIPLTVAYEDEQILVIDKPAGLVVHPGSGNWRGTLLNALLHRLPALAGLPRAGIVHRLDKDTSGLLVVAKTLEAQTDLVRQLQARTVRREYLALVRGTVERDGLVDAPIGRHPVQRTRMAVVARGRPARTHYRVRERLAGATLVECALESGRTHQIRVHMAHIGHPILGDPVYARHAAGGVAFGRQALHAWRLGLRHPASGAALHWESALPQDMAGLLDRLRREKHADD
ncbi:MAG TPA: RluA family pseudouridine synthase [Rhodocyclaceae bacterium]|jgi:23S rRNA pseudouridine1911/1915/1917 synthase|nr:RluA family pseudouridine synthase [Rhodocyclaceae bacterium]